MVRQTEVHYYKPRPMLMLLHTNHIYKYISYAMNISHLNNCLMNALKCRTLTTKTLLCTHTPQHKQKLSLKYIIIEQRVGVLSHQLANRFVLELVNLWTKLHR